MERRIGRTTDWSLIVTKTIRRVPAGFTLAELMVVIVVIAILAAFLLPALLRGRDTAQRTQARSDISSIGLALDGFYNAFGYYPPTTNSFDPATGRFDGPAYGDYGYSEALVQCLCNKFTRGTGDEGAANDLTKIVGIDRVIGKAPVNIGPLYQAKANDLIDLDHDGFPELADPWGAPYIYIPKDDYLKADGHYNAGAMVWADTQPVGGDGVLDPPDPSAFPLENEHFRRFAYQLISLGPDGWTPGLDATLNAYGKRYASVNIDDNPLPACNPALVGTDYDPSRPYVTSIHPDETADDISNLR